VITVYASASFVVIELINNLTEPLSLPPNLATLVIIILAVGFPLAIILSWLYDLTGEGMEKTKPLSEVREGEKIAVPNAWKFATYVSFVVIIGLVTLNIVGTNRVSESLTQYGKSIAVLPFINDTQDKENDQFISGTMESILNNLSKIKDLRVVTRSSVEKYRDTFIPIPMVAEEQNVSYVLKGSMQKYGDQIRITLYLIDKNDRLMWSEQYDREIKDAAEYFAFWSEIAQLVAEELEVVITPEEQHLMEKLPTTSLSAHTYFQRGLGLYEESFREGEIDTTKLRQAEELYHEALDTDSAYAPAYAQLAWVVAESGWKFSSRQVQFD